MFRAVAPEVDPDPLERPSPWRSKLTAKIAKRELPDLRGADQLPGPDLPGRQEDRPARTPCSPCTAIVRYWLVDDLYAADEVGAAILREPREGTPLQPLDGGHRSARWLATECWRSAPASATSPLGWCPRPLPRERSQPALRRLPAEPDLRPALPRGRPPRPRATRPPSRRWRGQFDTVICLNVLEHVADRSPPCETWPPPSPPTAGWCSTCRRVRGSTRASTGCWATAAATPAATSIASWPRWAWSPRKKKNRWDTLPGRDGPAVDRHPRLQRAGHRRRAAAAGGGGAAPGRPRAGDRGGRRRLERRHARAAPRAARPATAHVPSSSTAANRGKGAAMRTGFAAASGDVVLIQDADLEYDPARLPRRCSQPIVEGEADVVFGSRFLGGRAPRAASSGTTWATAS